MRPPQELSKHLKSAVVNADENSLVKMRTLLGWMARIITMLPTPSRGLNVRRSQDGDVWTVPEPDAPARIDALGRISPILVGGLMPTLDGDPLDDTTNVLDMSIDGPVWFKLTFTIAFTESYLSSWTLDTVEVEQGASLPTDTDDEKHLQFNTIANASAGASYFNTAIPIVLADNGPNETLLLYT